MWRQSEKFIVISVTELASITSSCFWATFSRSGKINYYYVSSKTSLEGRKSCDMLVKKIIIFSRTAASTMNLICIWNLCPLLFWLKPEIERQVYNTVLKCVIRVITVPGCDYLVLTFTIRLFRLNCEWNGLNSGGRKWQRFDSLVIREKWLWKLASWFFSLLLLVSTFNLTFISQELIGKVQTMTGLKKS